MRAEKVNCYVFVVAAVKLKWTQGRFFIFSERLGHYIVSQPYRVGSTRSCVVPSRVRAESPHLSLSAEDGLPPEASATLCFTPGPN